MAESNKMIFAELVVCLNAGVASTQGLVFDKIWMVCWDSQMLRSKIVQNSCNDKGLKLTRKPAVLILQFKAESYAAATVVSESLEIQT